MARSSGLRHLWTPDGPTEEAVATLEGTANATAPASARLLNRIAFDLFNGRGKAELGRCLAVLDCFNLESVASLMLAVSQGELAIRQWMHEERRAGR